MPLTLRGRPPRRLRRTVATIALATASVAALAQTSTAPPPVDPASPLPSATTAPRPPRSRPPFNVPGPEWVGRRVQTIDEQVKLTPDQRAEVLAAFHDQTERMTAINAKYGTTDQMRAEMSELRAVSQETRAKITTILTPPQAKQWNEFLQARRARSQSRLQHELQRSGATRPAPASDAPTSGAPASAPSTSGAPK
jgi:Spy/CpxP family protein refolding chaperone